MNKKTPQKKEQKKQPHTHTHTPCGFYDATLHTKKHRTQNAKNSYNNKKYFEVKKAKRTQHEKKTKKRRGNKTHNSQHVHARRVADEAYYTCPGVDGRMRGPDREGTASTAAPLVKPNEQSRKNVTAVVIFIFL